MPIYRCTILGSRATEFERVSYSVLSGSEDGPLWGLADRAHVWVSGAGED